MDHNPNTDFPSQWWSPSSLSIVCMYVMTIFSQRPLRGFSGALKGCSESFQNNCYFSSLSNKYVLMSCFEMLLFPAIWTCVFAGKLYPRHRSRLQLRIRASAWMSTGSEGRRGKISRRIANFDVPRLLKPEHRVPAEIKALFDECTLQREAESWIWFFVLLEASGDDLESVPPPVQTLEWGIRSRRRAAAFRIRWTRSVWTTEMPDNTELR